MMFRHASTPRGRLIGLASAEVVARAEPDGHALFLMSNGSAVTASLFKSWPCDVQRDGMPKQRTGRTA